MPIVRWTAAEARAAIDAPDLDRRLGPTAGSPAVVVDLTEATDPSGDAIAAALSVLPVVTIGCGPEAGPGWDIATTDPAAVVAGIEATPQAAVVTAQVLRHHDQRSTNEGLLTESLAYATLQSGDEFAQWLAGQGQRIRRDDSDRVRVLHERTATGDEAVVTLTRGRLHNLMDARMRDELVDALRAIGYSPETTVVLNGDGPSFCAGGDPAEFGTVAEPSTAHAIRSAANVAPWLHAIADRTEARIHGACVGAGVELAAVCGRVVADPDARFRLPEVSMGLLPGAGGTVSVPRRIGRQRTLLWLLSNADIDAPTALEWGLVDEIGPVARTK